MSLLYYPLQNRVRIPVSSHATIEYFETRITSSRELHNEVDVRVNSIEVK